MQNAPDRICAVRGVCLPGAHMEKMEHDAFMDRARAAYAVVQTGETALYGNIIIRKGVVRL